MIFGRPVGTCLAMLIATGCASAHPPRGGTDGSTGFLDAGVAPLCGSGRCAPGSLCCDGTCVYPTSDPANCGACNVHCAPDEACVDGSCLGGPPPHALFALGCTSNPVPDRHPAWQMLISHTAPDDGCAISGELDRFFVAADWPSVIEAGTTWVVGAGSEAYYNPAGFGTASGWTSVPSGELVFERYVDGMEASGRYRFTLADGFTIAGTFEVTCFESTDPPSGC